MSHLPSSLLLLLLLLLGLLLPFSISEPFINKNFTDCRTVSSPCGPQTPDITYPFLLPDRPIHCGHPGFDLTCATNTKNESALMIKLGEKNYQVIHIDYIAQVLTVADPNFSDPSNPCTPNFTNTTLDSSLFGYTDIDDNVTVYFNCSSRSNLHEIGCLDRSYYSLSTDSVQDFAALLEHCGMIYVMPIFYNQSIGDNDGDFWRALRRGFGVKWMAGDGWCDGCDESGGNCGYDENSPDAETCYCPKSTNSNGTCYLSEGSSNSTISRKIAIGIISGLAGILLVSLVLVLYIRRHTKIFNSIILWKKNSSSDKKIEAFLEKYGSIAPKRYSHSDIKKITKSFREKLGHGGYGTVFKGNLKDGHLVAVKILSESKGNGDEFVNEVASIGRTSHVNIVSLLGFSSEGSKRALIYDFMSNGSLEKLIYYGKPETIKDWEMLYQIATDIARGLEYLHRGCNTRIVHFDIKPHNILLDKDFCPKISDFGLAKLCPEKGSILSMADARGTIGYIAPEVFSRNFGVVSSKSDVYSYGMMVLEMVGEKNNAHPNAENSSENYFPHWIYKKLDQNGDLGAYGATPETEEIARKMILIGLWCIQTMPHNRPSISRVIEMLEGSINDLQVPPKPYLSSPLESLMGASSINESYLDNCISLVHS